MSNATPEEQAKARAIGWRPETEFKGDPDRWVDADEYLRRGEEVLPLVKAENRRLSEQMARQTAEIQRLAGIVEEQRTSMSSMAEFSLNQLKEKLAEQKRTLTAQLRQATKDEDDSLAAQLEERIEEVVTQQDKLKAPTPPVATPAPAQPTAETPEFLAWKQENTWYGGTSRADQAKTAAAHRFAQEAAARGLRGAAFFEEVDAALAEVYPPAQKRKDPTEEGRPSGSGGSSSSRDKDFNALPAEAKAKAREQTTKFVGANKVFKKAEDWYSYYAKQYFATEA